MIILSHPATFVRISVYEPVIVYMLDPIVTLSPSQIVILLTVEEADIFKTVNDGPEQISLSLEGPMEFKAKDIADKITDFKVLNFHIFSQSKWYLDKLLFQKRKNHNKRSKNR